MESITYEIIVGRDEPDQRLERLHDNVKKFSTVFIRWRQARNCRAFCEDGKEAPHMNECFISNTGDLALRYPRH